MSWRERAQKLSKVPRGALTKPTEVPIVSSVSTQTGAFQSFRVTMCPACAEDRPGQCERRSTPTWESCWAKAHPELLS
jgi:hypothetical protein